MKAIRPALFFLLGVSTFACASKSQSRIVSRAESMDSVACVAVLPFENMTKTQNAGRILASMVSQAAIANGKFGVMDGASIETYLEDQQGLRLSRRIDAALAQNLASLLEVDAVMIGTVNRYSYEKIGGRGIRMPVVSFSLDLIDAKTGQSIFSALGEGSSTDKLTQTDTGLSQVALAAVERVLASYSNSVGKSEAMGRCGRLEPDLDIDLDGILNMVDRCPYQAEDFNGVNDADGCPEGGIVDGELSRLVFLKGGRIEYRGEIQFMDDMDTVLPHSKLLIQAIATFIKRNEGKLPKVQVEVVSDREGVEKFSELFAYSRAEAVKKILIEGGVNVNQVSAVGFGNEDQSLATRADTRKNVEFILVE